MSQSIALLNPLDRSAIERILLPLLVRQHAQLKLFGSRARGDARRVSDIDLALVAGQPIAADEMAVVREALEESGIPFRIDLIDYASAPAPLRAAIDREGIAWPVQTSV
jgi:uncharacterized protein